MERLGLPSQVVRVEGATWDFEQIGYDGGMDILKKDGFATDTVLCSNDRLAIGLIAAANELNVPVGRGPGCRLRVAGHDDHPFSRFTSPSLTTVAQDYAAISSIRKDRPRNGKKRCSTASWSCAPPLDPSQSLRALIND
jgi:DNA-binding LacI/PurR family transcriptional regulator